MVFSSHRADSSSGASHRSLAQIGSRLAYHLLVNADESSEALPLAREKLASLTRLTEAETGALPPELTESGGGPESLRSVVASLRARAAQNPKQQLSQ